MQPLTSRMREEYEKLSPNSEHGASIEVLGISKEKFYERRARQWRLVSIVLFVLGAFTIGFLLQNISRSNCLQRESLPYAGVLVPELKKSNVIFMNDSRFVSGDFLASKDEFEKGIEEWYNLVPAGFGFIQVSHEDRIKYDLPTPMNEAALQENSYSDLPIYSMSSFHKLHCLMTIMEVYARPKLGLEENPLTTSNESAHVGHCYDYLRQSILCESDTALEGRSPYREEFGTDGWGARHVCKDHRALFHWAEEHQVKKLPLR